MKRSYKIIGVILVVLLVIVVVIGLTADDYIEKQITKTIKTEIPDHITIDYESMEFSTFQGNLIFKNSEVSFKDPNSDTLVSKIMIKDVSILDISYWEYFTNKNFIIQRLELNNPIIEHRFLKVDQDSVVADSTNNGRNDPNWQKKLKIEELVINDANIKVNDLKTDSLLFETRRGDFTINEVLIDSTMGDLIPFKYESYSGKINELYYKIGEYEDLRITEVQFLPSDIKMKNIGIKTKYDRISYDRMLTQERDWFNIDIDSIRISNSEFGKVNDSINKFSADTTTIYQPNVSIYRNKLIADEYDVKPYYSQILRELPFELSLNKIVLEKGYVSYEEKVIAEHAAGKLEFSEFFASIYNFGNTYPEDINTTVDINTNFMETTPLNVNWSFDYHDESDAYNFKGDLGSINTQVLNQFTNRNLNVMLEGTLHKTFFTINGNRNSSHIDIKINYDDFRIELINDKRNKPKKILNAIVNIFVSKDSNKSTNNFREGSADVERNYKGSFYNNLWLNLSSGIRKAITGGSNDE